MFKIIMIISEMFAVKLFAVKKGMWVNRSFMVKKFENIDRICLKIT